MSYLVSLIAVSNPKISVLCPTTDFLLKCIVFTDWVISASGLNLSKNGIIFSLKGTVTFIPFIFSYLILEIKFSIS